MEAVTEAAAATAAAWATAAAATMGEAAASLETEIIDEAVGWEDWEVDWEAEGRSFAMVLAFLARFLRAAANEEVLSALVPVKGILIIDQVGIVSFYLWIF